MWVYLAVERIEGMVGVRAEVRLEHAVRHDALAGRSKVREQLLHLRQRHGLVLFVAQEAHKVLLAHWRIA